MKFKYHFVFPCSLKSLNLNLIDAQSPGIFVDSHRAWCLQTYLRLKDSAVKKDISFGFSPKSGVINIIHCDTISGLSFKERYSNFFVVIVSDRRVYFDGEINIIQNFNQKFRDRDVWLPHWPQIGLITDSKNVNFNKKIRYLSYYGLSKNSLELRTELPPGVSISFKEPEEWHDYRNCDAVIAIRNDMKQDYSKPPTKLINAMLAEKLFIASPDSAYSQIAEDSEDYYSVKNCSELYSILENNQKIKVNFKKFKSLYNFDMISNYWVSTMVTHIPPFYYQWQKKSKIRRIASEVIRTCFFHLRRVKRRVKMTLNDY